MKYNKLIRDRIPEIMKEKGKFSKTHIADDTEYFEKLADKLLEEANEFQEGRNAEELADVLEVVYALAAAKSLSKSQLEAIREKKFVERGGFSKRIVLDETQD